MHWTEVEGYPMPNLLGGHPALDFCNTWAGWGQPPHPRREWLPDYDRLAVWAGHARLLVSTQVARCRAHGRRQRVAGAAVLTEAREVRAALYRTLTEPGDPRSFRRVARSVERAAAAARFVATADGSARWELPTSAGIDLPLLAVSHAAGDLLTINPRVGRCPGSDCGWLFLDPRSRRRWCDMASCGNRAKVRAHAARQRASS